MENLILSLKRYVIIFFQFIIEAPQLIFEKGIHEKVGKNWAWILWHCKMSTRPLFLAYLQWASSLFLKLFTLSADTTVSGSEFHDITSTVLVYIFIWEIFHEFPARNMLIIFSEREYLNYIIHTLNCLALGY